MPYNTKGATTPLIQISAVMENGSSVPRVGATRGDNWGCHPFSPKKLITFFLFSHHRLSVRQYHPNISPQKADDLFGHYYRFHLLHSGVTPWRVSPHTFLPARPPLSTVLCKFSHIFSFGCHPLKGVTRGRPPLCPLMTPLPENVNVCMTACVAIGCRDPEPPKYGWVVRESDGVYMGCNFSNHHWRLTCDGVRWTGQYENCSSGKHKHNYISVYI